MTYSGNVRASINGIVTVKIKNLKGEIGEFIEEAKTYYRGEKYSFLRPTAEYEGMLPDRLYVFQYIYTGNDYAINGGYEIFSEEKEVVLTAVSMNCLLSEDYREVFKYFDEEKIAKLQTLLKPYSELGQLLKNGEERLLWLPPSEPYYAPAGPYADIKNYSKTLILNPDNGKCKYISQRIASEAEQLNIKKTSGYNKRNGLKGYEQHKIDFKLDGDKPASMWIYCLLYPSDFLTQCYNPQDCLKRGIGLSEIKEEIKAKIAERLSKFPEKDIDKQVTDVDERWYHVALFWLDDNEYLKKWLYDKISTIPKYNESIAREEGMFGHTAGTHSDWLYSFPECLNTINLGKKPDDLLDVLADIAISSPAVCVNRFYKKYCLENYSASYASRVAVSLIWIFNKAEASAIVENSYGKTADGEYWKSVLKYCRDGNLQAVLDDYMKHMFNHFCKVMPLERTQKALSGAMTMSTALALDGAYKLFTVWLSDFAADMDELPLAGACSSEDRFSDGTRDGMLNAFNSPFRPFVLALTCDGKVSGIDFKYCNKIVR